MSHLVANQTGNFGTAATWDTGTNTPTIHATTNIAVSGTIRFTATFTAPNTTNACTGVVMYMSDNTYTDHVLTLQEDLGGTGTWVDTAATVTIADPSIFTNGVFFAVYFPTPYTFATTGANRYRFKLSATGSGSVAADSGGTTYSFLALDDRHAVPVDGDNAIICIANTVTPTVTVDGTQAVGNNGTVSTTSNVPRDLSFAVYVTGGAKIKWDTATSATLTCKGMFYISTTGIWEMQPASASVISSLVFTAATNTQYGPYASNFSASVGGCTLQGTSKTYYKTTYVSGTGTAASPLVVADPVDWSVGDEVLVAPGTDSATNYDETEYRYIITKNSSTSYVLSNTAGGAEAALTFSKRTTTPVMNLTRNVVIKGVSSSIGMVGAWFASQTSLDKVDIDWVRFENMGNSATAYILIGNRCEANYCVAYQTPRLGFAYSARTLTNVPNITDMIACKNTYASTSSTGGGQWISTCRNQTFERIYSFDHNSHAISMASSFGNTLNDCQVWGAGTATTQGGWLWTTSGNNTINNGEAQACRSGGHAMTGATDNTFVNFQSGNKATNASSIYLLTDTYSTATFTKSNFNDATLVANSTLALSGTEIRFQNFNDSDYDHRWVTSNGTGLSTGAGLADTTTRTAGSLAVRLNPETDAGFNFRFKILARADTAVSVLGFVKLNATLTGDADTACTATLVLPGSAITDASATLSKATNDWQVFSLAANYTGDVDAYATVTVNVTNPNATAGVYAYVDDIYNGTNNITAIDVWDEGKPSEIMFEQLGDAAAVWAVLTSTLTTSGTVGNHLAKKVSTKSVPKY